MASPIVQEAIESSTNTAGTSHVVTLPTATAGQLLLIILDKGSTAATINAHASLTELLDENSANGLYIAYRWMDGTEPASYTLVSTASTRSARIAYRISGAANPSTTPPQIGTTATGTSATPNPPISATPPSSKDYLFIAFYGAAGEEADDDTWSDTPPTSFTPSPPRQKACGTVGTNLGGMIASAERALTTGSAQDPGTFAKDVSAAWRAQTITIHPHITTFAEIRQDIINGLDSAQSEATGWDAEVKAKLPVTAVVRTSNTVVTITLDAQAGYDITAQETIEATIPASALVGATPIVATPTFTIDPAAGAYVLDCAPGGYAVSGIASGVLAGRMVSASPGSYGVTGLSTLLGRGFNIPVEPGDYAITGANASLMAARLLNASPGDYAVVGASAGILADRFISGNPGVYVLTGVGAIPLAGRVINGESGNYAVTGVNATLARGYFISADGGVYAITGNDAAILTQRLISTDVGSYLITGIAAQVLADRLLNAEPGTYAITGVVADLVHTGIGAYVLAVDPGSYLVTGTEAGLLATRILNADPGVYAITGTAASIVANRNIILNPGTYILTGFDADLNYPSAVVESPFRPIMRPRRR